MEFAELLKKLTPDMYQRLRTAVEIGRWPDGTSLTAEQRELSMQAVIAYDLQHHNEEDRVGFIDRGSKAEGELCGDEQPAPVKWLQ